MIRSIEAGESVTHCHMEDTSLGDYCTRIACMSQLIGLLDKISAEKSEKKWEFGKFDSLNLTAIYFLNDQKSSVGNFTKGGSI